MKYNLLLDDVRDEKMTFHASGNTIYMKLTWIIVRNYDEFKDFILKNGLPELISFDHDLEDQDYDRFEDGEDYSERTGKECAAWLVDYCMENKKEIPKYLIHSQNPDGKRRIESVFSTYFKMKERGLLDD